MHGITKVIASSAVTLALGLAWARWIFGPGYSHETERMNAPLQDFEQEFLTKYARKQQEESGFMTRPRTQHATKIRIFYRFWFPKQPKVRGVVIALHGMDNHTGNSNQFYAVLLEKGFVVAGMDYEGHGRSQGRHGFFSSVDDIVDDAIAFIELTKAKFADQKLFLIGRSLGGLLVLHILLKMLEPRRIAGVVVQYPAISVGERPSPVVEWIGKCLCAFVPKMVIVPAAQDKSNSLATQQRVDQLMLRDALHYKGGIRIGTGLAIMDAMQSIQARFDQLERPLLLQHGTADQLCPIAGSKALFDQCTAQDKTFKAYQQAGHDLAYDELHAQAVIHDFCAWLETRL